MAESDTGELSLEMPSTAGEHRTNTRLLQHSCLSSDLCSFVVAIGIGLVSGAAGGQLLGWMAVVLLQSLEILAENKLLMDKLTNNTLLMGGFDDVPYKHISIFAEEFGVISSTLSSTLGVFAGLATYKRVTEKHGEAAKAKALGLAGSVCLMTVTITGCAVGPLLEVILSINLSLDILQWWLLLSLMGMTCMPLCLLCPCYERHTYIWSFLSCVCTVPFAGNTLLLSFLARSRLPLMVTVTPTIFFGYVCREIYDFHLTIIPVPLMLMIADVFVIARKPIIVLQPPASTDTSSVILESIFVGVLTSLMLTVAIGMSLFVSWQRGGAGKICAGALASGMAVCGAIKASLALLGPGLSIGALMGVAGAVGVSLSAGRAVADRYGWAGGLGVTLGAAGAAILTSSAHSGLSGVFMGLCAAVIPGGPYLQLLLGLLRRSPIGYKLCLYIVTPVILLIWSYFIHTPLLVFMIHLIFYMCIALACAFVLVCFYFFAFFLFCLFVLLAIGILYLPFFIIIIVVFILIELINYIFKCNMGLLNSR